MAARTGRLRQDPNLGIHMDGTTISAKENFTGQRKKAGAGGRKPLGDLSNSEKLSTQGGGRKALDVLNSGKQLKSKELSTVKEVVPVKIKNLENKRTAPKASEKLPTGNRKALSDISNFGKIKNESSEKPSALTEEHLLNAIAEERCLHNHQECIKSQTEVMNLSTFLKTVGLESDPEDKLDFSSELLKPKSNLIHLELEEIPEEWPEMELSSKDQSLATQHASPARCMSPKISSCYKMWEDFDVNFKLIETPKASKF